MVKSFLSTTLLGALLLTAADAFAAGGWTWAYNPTASTYDGPPNYSYNSAGGRIRIGREGTGTYNVTFDGLSMSGGNAQVNAYGAGNEYCNLRGWSASTVRVACYAQGGAPVDTRFVVSVVDRPPTYGGDRAVGYFWKDAYDSIPSYYSWNSTGGSNSLQKKGTGKYLVTVKKLGLHPSGQDWELPAGKPFVSAYNYPGGYCTAREHSLRDPILYPNSGGWRTDGLVYVSCFNASGQHADMAFSLIISQGHIMEGTTWGLWYRDTTGSALEAKVAGQFETSEGYTDWYGGAFARLIPEWSTGALVQSNGQLISNEDFAPPQRCKPQTWYYWNNGVAIAVSCFDVAGQVVGSGVASYNGAYATTQTALTP